MPKPENIANQGFHTNPERINKNGRPRKFISTLKEQGYKLSEINDTLMALLSMDMKELKEAFENPKATVLEKAVAGAIKKSIEKGSLYNIETIITRAMGKPKEQVDLTSGGEALNFDITLKL